MSKFVKQKKCGHLCGKFDPYNQLYCCICTNDTATCKECLERPITTDEYNQCYDCDSNDTVYSDEVREVMVCIKHYNAIQKVNTENKEQRVHDEIHRLLTILYGHKKNKAKQSVGIEVKPTVSQFIADWCKICKEEL